MNQTSSSQEITRRRALAEHAARFYAANAKVAAVLLAGSVARGTADRFSDIELDIFWAEMPSEDERLAPIEPAGGTLLYKEADENEWTDAFFIGGVKLDTSQFLTSTMERWLADATERADSDIEKQLLIAAVQHGQPLYGAALVKRWRATAAEYPDALIRTIVEANLSFRPRFLLEMLAARDDLLLLYKGIVEIEHLILNALLALNRQYVSHPRHKWLDWQCAQLRIAPPNLARRLKQILRDEPGAAVDQLHRLIEELFDLVDRQLPDFDTSAARAEFAQRRVEEEKYSK
jgi:hypothetical protein